MVPLLGGHSKADRARWIKGLPQLLGEEDEKNKEEEAEEALVSGYALQGLHANGPEAELLTSAQMTELARTSLVSGGQGEERCTVVTDVYVCGCRLFTRLSSRARLWIISQYPL